MRQSLKLVSALFALGLATAVLPCTASAARPAYQAAGPKGGMGWTTTTLPNGRVAVAYTGNAKMKKEDVANYALLRAAEFTQESGFEWFAVIATSVADVEVGSANDVAARNGAFLSGDTAGTGAGSGAGGRSGASGGGDAAVNMGPSTGGFGGGDVPPSVLERWQPRKVPQAVLIIQMGKGDEANFEGLAKQPDIFDAKSTIDELRAESSK